MRKLRHMTLKWAALEIRIQDHLTLKSSTFTSLFPTFLFMSSLLIAGDRRNSNSFKGKKNIYWISWRRVLKCGGGRFRPGWIQRSQDGHQISVSLKKTKKNSFLVLLSCFSLSVVETKAATAATGDLGLTGYLISEGERLTVFQCSYQPPQRTWLPILGLITGCGRIGHCEWPARVPCPLLGWWCHCYLAGMRGDVPMRPTAVSRVLGALQPY